VDRGEGLAAAGRRAAPIRVLFFGNSEGVFSNRHFAALLACRCRIVGVVDVPAARRTSTNRPSTAGPRSFVAEARERGVPIFEPERPNASEFTGQAAGTAPDLLLAVGYLNRLGEKLLTLPRVGAANFHASLLPAYRGKHPVFWALRNGESRCGMTVHAMDPGLDTGDIIFQVKVRTRRDDSVASLYDRIMDRSVPLVRRLVECAARGELPRRPQTEGGASSYSSVSDADFRLDWAGPAERLRRWVCASPGQCWTTAAGARLYVMDAELARGPGRARLRGAAPGTVREAGGGAITAAAADGALLIRRIRSADGRDIGAARALGELGAGDGAVLGT
jgi:methionyl-tRNA formyltransferase